MEGRRRGTGKATKADAADRAKAKLEDLQRVAGDYAEAVTQANADLHKALIEHGDEIRRLAGEREAKARAKLRKATEPLEHGQAELAYSHAVIGWLDKLALGGTPSAAARHGLGSGTTAPTFSPGAYFGRIPRPGRGDLGGKDDALDFAKLLTALREVADPPPDDAPALRPVPEAA